MASATRHGNVDFISAVFLYCSIVSSSFFISFPFFPDIFLSRSPSLAPKSTASMSLSCLRLMRRRSGLCYHDLFFIYLLSGGASLALSAPGPGQRSVRWSRALWVGGGCMRGTLWAACCWLLSPLNLCSFSALLTPFFFFLFFSPPFFSPSSCGGGKNLQCGLFVLVWCRFSHVLGEPSYLRDSSLDCEGLSRRRVHVLVRRAAHAVATATTGPVDVYSCVTVCVCVIQAVIVNVGAAERWPASTTLQSPASLLLLSLTCSSSEARKHTPALLERGARGLQLSWRFEGNE